MTEIVAQLQQINVVKDLLVPAAAAIFGIWFATRKFRKEQIWKEKYLSYQSVLRSLESISHWASETRSGVYMVPTIGTENIAREYSQAHREVLRQVTLGPLLLSDEFCVRLMQFTEDFHSERFNAAEEHFDDPHEEDMAWGEHASAVESLVQKHLPELIKLARKDLGA